MNTYTLSSTPQKRPVAVVIALAAIVLFAVSFGVAAFAIMRENETAPPPMTHAQIREAAQVVSYDELVQNTDAHVGELVLLRGQVLNVWRDGETSTMILNVGSRDASDGFAALLAGQFQNVIVQLDDTGRRPIQRDQTVSVYGHVKGRTPFVSPVGMEFQWPEVTALLVEFVQRVGK